MKITNVEISEIVVQDRFREDLGDLIGLQNSIEAKGLLQPITIDQNNRLLAGERRLNVCINLGHKKIACVIRKTEGEIDALEIELIENICRKDMDWTERAKLEKNIYDLRLKVDPDWSLEKQAVLTGHSKGAIARRVAIADVIDGVPELADMPNEGKAWKAYKALEERMVVDALRKKGYENQEIKGASKYAKDHFRVADALIELPKIRAEVVHFAEVDPPYAIDLIKRKGRSNEPMKLASYNEIAPDEYVEFITKVATETYRILRKNTFCVWWFGMTWYTPVKDILTGVGFKVNDIPAIWTKGGQGQTAAPDSALASGYEPFFLCRKGSPKMPKAGRSNVFEFSPVAAQKKIHPTERPIELMVEIINTFVYPSSIVLIPFLGSGATLRAVYKCELTGFGYDLDEMNKGRFLDILYKDQVNINEKEE